MEVGRGISREITILEDFTQDKIISTMLKEEGNIKVKDITQTINLEIETPHKMNKIILGKEIKEICMETVEINTTMEKEPRITTTTIGCHKRRNTKKDSS